jgi:hypothetical protein
MTTEIKIKYKGKDLEPTTYKFSASTQDITFEERHLLVVKDYENGTTVVKPTEGELIIKRAKNVRVSLHGSIMVEKSSKLTLAPTEDNSDPGSIDTITVHRTK